MVLLLLITSCASAGLAAKQPNILFFLTDDQDKIVGGWDQMKKAKQVSNITLHNPVSDSFVLTRTRATRLAILRH